MLLIFLKIELQSSQVFANLNKQIVPFPYYVPVPNINGETKFCFIITYPELRNLPLVISFVM